MLLFSNLALLAVRWSKEVHDPFTTNSDDIYPSGFAEYNELYSSQVRPDWLYPYFQNNSVRKDCVRGEGPDDRQSIDLELFNIIILYFLISFMLYRGCVVVVDRVWHSHFLRSATDGDRLYTYGMCVLSLVDRS